MKVKNEVADALANSTVEENNLYLPNVQLERNLYLAVNKVLVAIGGKWNRKAKAHVFDKPPADALEEILLTGEYTDQKVEYQFFETPEVLAKRLVEMADIQEGETVLEPSAGKGAIAKLLPNCDCVELEDGNHQYLQENGFAVVGSDFLSFREKYDVIVANPPFSKQQDIDHVSHMLCLAVQCVVSVMSVGVMFRTNKKTVAFRELIDRLGGTIELLPDNSFAESGTKVRACVVCVNRRPSIQELGAETPAYRGERSELGL